MVVMGRMGWRPELHDFVRSLARLACLLPLASLPVEAAECSADPGILFSSCAGETTARLVLTGENGVDVEPGIPGLHRVTVTGAYTSGERREPEGLFIVAGEALDPVPQGWDGVAVIDERGRLSLHYARRIDMGDERWNLRDGRSRKAFAKAAAQRGWSVLQSHMLVIDGRNDTRPRDGAPRFTRRLLYTLADGTIGLYETPPMTLHGAASAIMDALSPVMAFNLDMGSYDYCRRDAGQRSEDCGTLAPSQTAKLSNVLILSQIPGKKVAATR
jgi:hypothetical protein